MPRRLGALAVGALALAAATPALAAAAGPVATRIDLVERPAFTRVLVTLSGGAVSSTEGDMQALDPEVADGRATVEIAEPGIRTTAAPVARAGLRVTLVQRRGRLVALVTAPARRFKFLSYGASRAKGKVVIDLWKSTVAPAAARLDDGCLSLDQWKVRAASVVARGKELEPLFEHGLVLTLRDAAGRQLGIEPITATAGRPEFGPYRTPGRWGGGVSYAPAPTARPAMLEAWVSSARDGALQCLVQTPVALPAGPAPTGP